MGPFAFGTKCSWDFWHLGQNVVGTFGIWDNSLFFGTDMHWDKKYWDKMSLGQFTCGQKVFGTIHLLSKSHWDNSLGDTVSCIKTGKIALRVKNGMGI